MHIPWWAKIIIGLGGFAILMVLFDLLEMLEVFLYTFLIPFTAIRLILFAGEGTVEAVGGTPAYLISDLKARAWEWRNYLKEQDKEAVASSGR